MKLHRLSYLFRRSSLWDVLHIEGTDWCYMSRLVSPKQSNIWNWTEDIYIFVYTPIDGSINSYEEARSGAAKEWVLTEMGWYRTRSQNTHRRARKKEKKIKAWTEMKEATKLQGCGGRCRRAVAPVTFFTPVTLGFYKAFPWYHISGCNSFWPYAS